MEMTLGDRIRQLREARGLTRLQLGERAELHESHIGLLERNERPNARHETMQKLADALGVSVEYLLTGMPAANDPYADVVDYLPIVRYAKERGINPIQLNELVKVVASIKG